MNLSPMDAVRVENELDILLGRQSMILSLIKEKLDIVNYIKDGYDKNAPVLMNSRFLHFTAHVYFRSIVVDFCALFVNRNSEKHNFHKIYQDSRVACHLESHVPPDLQLLLESRKEDTNRIHFLRDKEYAHYDFLENKMSFSLKETPMLNRLFNTSVEILKVCEDGRRNSDESRHTELGVAGYIDSLQRLIKHG